MKSITAFLRRKGYALAEIQRLLQDLEPNCKHNPSDFGGGSALAKIVDQLRDTPELAHLAAGRASLEEAGIHPITESGHTLKLPLSSRRNQVDAWICFTRVAPDRWVYYLDRPSPPGSRPEGQKLNDSVRPDGI